MRQHGYSELLMWALFEKIEKGMPIKEVKETYGISNDSVQGWMYRTMMENGEEEKAEEIAQMA